jgi:hypothetical protein
MIKLAPQGQRNRARTRARGIDMPGEETCRDFA